jgi:hypothetical protein
MRRTEVDEEAPGGLSPVLSPRCRRRSRRRPVALLVLARGRCWRSRWPVELVVAGLGMSRRMPWASVLVVQLFGSTI